MDLSPLHAFLTLPTLHAEALLEIASLCRVLRGSVVGNEAAQSALLSLGAPSTLSALIRLECLHSAPSDPTPTFRRVLWQTLSNLCAGHPASQAAVWEAVLAGEGSSGACALLCGATAAASDPALASVVLGLVYTAAASACYGGSSSSSAQPACAARLAQLCSHPLLLPALLRPCLPSLGQEGASLSHAPAQPSAADDIALWCRLLAGSLLLCGHLPAALAAASTGLAAEQLLLPSGGPGSLLKVTAESTALVCALEAELEGASQAQLQLQHAGLIASIPALCHLLTQASSGALAMAGLLSSPPSSADTGPLLLLPRLQLGLCLRAAEAAAGLLSDACTALVVEGEADEQQQLQQPSVPPGTATAILSLLAAATPLISATAEQPPPSSSSSAAAPPPTPESSPYAPYLQPAASLFSRRLPPPPPPALRTALTRALAHVLHGGGGGGARAEALRAGGVPVLLAQTKMDGESITVREWALLGLKHWCDGGGEEAALARAVVQAVREGAAGSVARELPAGVE